VKWLDCAPDQEIIKPETARVQLYLYSFWWMAVLACMQVLPSGIVYTCRLSEVSMNRLFRRSKDTLNLHI